MTLRSNSDLNGRRGSLFLLLLAALLATGCPSSPQPEASGSPPPRPSTTVASPLTSGTSPIGPATAPNGSPRPIPASPGSVTPSASPGGPALSSPTVAGRRGAKWIKAQLINVSPRTVTYRDRRGVFVATIGKNCQVWRIRWFPPPLMAQVLKTGSPVTLLLGPDGSVQRLVNGDATLYNKSSTDNLVKVGALVDINDEHVTVKQADGSNGTFPLSPKCGFFRREDIALDQVNLPLDVFLEVTSATNTLTVVRLPLMRRPKNGIQGDRGTLVGLTDHEIVYKNAYGQFTVNASPNLRICSERNVPDVSAFAAGTRGSAFVYPDGTARWVAAGDPDPVPLKHRVKGHDIEGTFTKVAKDVVTLQTDDGKLVDVRLAGSTRLFIRQSDDRSKVKLPITVAVALKIPNDARQPPEAVYVRLAPPNRLLQDSNADDAGEN